MVTKWLTILLLVCVSFFASCQRFKVLEVGGQTIVKSPKFKTNYILDEKGIQSLDTSSIYVYQGNYFKFYASGEVIRGSLFYSPPSNKQSFQIHANSVYRGRYELRDNRIKLELFYPGEPFLFLVDGNEQHEKEKLLGIQLK